MLWIRDKGLVPAGNRTTVHRTFSRCPNHSTAYAVRAFDRNINEQYSVRKGSGRSLRRRRAEHRHTFEMEWGKPRNPQSSWPVCRTSRIQTEVVITKTPMSCLRACVCVCLCVWELLVAIQAVTFLCVPRNLRYSWTEFTKFCRQEQEILHFCRVPKPALGPIQLNAQWVPGVAGAWSWLFASICFRVMNEWSYTSTPLYICLYDVHKGNLIYRTAKKVCALRTLLTSLLRSATLSTFRM